MLTMQVADPLLFWIFIAFPAGFGRHIWDVNYGQLTAYSDYLTPLAIIYMWYVVYGEPWDFAVPTGNH